MTSEQWQQAKKLYAQIEPLPQQERTEILQRQNIDQAVYALVIQMLDDNDDEL